MRAQKGFLCFKKPKALYWEEAPPPPESLDDGGRSEEDGAGGGSGGRKAPAGGALLTEVNAADATCPLEGYDAGAVEWSIPAALRELGPKYAKATRGASSVQRVWATVLSVATLLRLQECCLVSSPGEADETVVDRALGWLNLQEHFCPGLERMIPDLLEEADRLVADSWDVVHEIAVNNARHAHMSAAELYRAAQLTRAAGRVVTMALVKHETVACFTAPPSDGVLRYQRVVVYLTAIIAMLCVEVRPMTSHLLCFLPHRPLQPRA